MKIPARITRIVCFFIILGFLAGCASAAPTAPTQTPIPVPEGWSLFWHDEFDGKSINAQNWNYDLGGDGWGNGEMQTYTDAPDNARLENGLLILEARKETNASGGFKFTSARLTTQGLQTFQYGRVEARIKVPAGAGLWPAFWMLGSNFKTIGWPDCGEIDIMEHVGKDPTLILGTMHGPGYSGALGLTKWNRQTYNIADDFHIYAIEWDKDQISWFYDDVKYSTYTRSDVEPKTWVFDQPFFVILNLAVGGTLGGLVNPDTVFPAQYLVDYVRVYDMNQ